MLLGKHSKIITVSKSQVEGNFKKKKHKEAQCRIEMYWRWVPTPTQIQVRMKSSVSLFEMCNEEVAFQRKTTYFSSRSPSKDPVLHLHGFKGITHLSSCENCNNRKLEIFLLCYESLHMVFPATHLYKVFRHLSS